MTAVINYMKEMFNRINYTVGEKYDIREAFTCEQTFLSTKYKR